MGWRPGLELLKVNAQVLLNRTINSLFQWPRNLPLHAGIAPLFICLSEQVCPFTYLINDTEIRNCVCRGTFQAGLCLQQYHMFVQCIHSQSGLLLLLSHMFVQCICSQSGLCLLLSHMFVQCICSQNHSQLYHDGLVSDNLLFLWAVLWICFFFLLCKHSLHCSLHHRAREVNSQSQITRETLHNTSFPWEKKKSVLKAYNMP